MQPSVLPVDMSKICKGDANTPPPLPSLLSGTLWQSLLFRCSRASGMHVIYYRAFPNSGSCIQPNFASHVHGIASTQAESNHCALSGNR